MLIFERFSVKEHVEGLTTQKRTEREKNFLFLQSDYTSFDREGLNGTESASRGLAATTVALKSAGWGANQVRRKLPQPASLQLCDSRKRVANLPPTGVLMSDGVPAQPGQLSPIWRIKDLFGFHG